MKGIKLAIFLAFLVIILSCEKQENTSQKYCDEMKSMGIIDSFSYPITPGTPEWKKLKNTEEKRKAVNIPEHILQNMCTHGLVYSCAKCPSYREIWAFSDKQVGFEVLVRDINSFAELCQRGDAGREFFDYYRTLQPADYDTTWTNIEKGDFVIHIYVTEVYLSRQVFLTQLTKRELGDIINDVYLKYKEKEKYDLSQICKLGSFYLISNILYYNLEYQPFISFVENNPRMPTFLSNFVPAPVTYADFDSLKFYTKSFLQTLNE